MFYDVGICTVRKRKQIVVTRVKIHLLKIREMFSVYIIVLVCYIASLYFADSDFRFFGLAFYRTNQLVLCVFQLLIHC